LARSVLVGLVAATACGPAAKPTPVKQPLLVKFLYPSAESARQMGQSLRAIVQVTDEGGAAVKDASVTITIEDPAGANLGSVEAVIGDGDVYRNMPWTIPHKQHEGTWTISASAETATGAGTGSTSFEVKDSISETLLKKYGFWADNPTFKGIETNLYKEEGDAENGVIVWGGLLPTQHIFVESWLEIQWRKGNFSLSTPEGVRDFILGKLGDLGFTPVREIGPFERVKFKQWDAWRATVRGQFSRYDGQWVIFYAPEVDKTYGIGTTVVQPPTGVDIHDALRKGFEVHPEVHANGKAPEPLPELLPQPELIGPAIGEKFVGDAEPIVLTWKPVKELAAGEYYKVHIDYNYDEANIVLNYSTTKTEIAIPAGLYDRPNCGVFNWQVTLMRQTGTDRDGQPIGVPLSYDSLYRYVGWTHPVGQAPFKPLCPNPQT
jgi:hypothetical protein